MPLLRKLSAGFRKSKDTRDNGKSRNGGLSPLDEGEASLQAERAAPNTQMGASIGTSLEKTKDIVKTSSNERQTLSNPAVPAAHHDNTAVTRRDVEDTFQQFAQLIHASRRPLPSQSGDGEYLEKQEPSGLMADLRSLGLKDIKTVKDMLQDKASGQPQDDRKMHMEEIMQLIAALPDRSANRVELTSILLDQLWNSLQHPPMSYLGDDFRYRSADGSRNSYIFPMLGAANTPYARSVNPVTVQPGALPDPGLLFDSLLAREDFKPHPNNISSIFFNWASLIIHGWYLRPFPATS